MKDNDLWCAEGLPEAKRRRMTALAANEQRNVTNDNHGTDEPEPPD